MPTTALEAGASFLVCSPVSSCFSSAVLSVSTSPGILIASSNTWQDKFVLQTFKRGRRYLSNYANELSE